MHGYSIFAVAAPGLEDTTAVECRGLGFAARPERGGVAWDGPLADVWNANLCLRTASRVLVRAGRFRARTFHELERHALRVDWARFLRPGVRARLRVTCRKSRLYHEGAVAERLLDAVERASGVRGIVDRPGAVRSDHDASLLFVVRMFRDVCTVSADSSGARLHLRGYREAVGRAPLRETLAAAMLLASGWDGSSPLVDPLCGSGTIAIEAALLARRIAPGLAAADRKPRSFAFERWPEFRPKEWRRLVDRAVSRILPRHAGKIVASDRSRSAIRAAVSNAARAGVAADIEFDSRPLDDLTPPAGPGHLVTNPPYGVRTGDRAQSARVLESLDRRAADTMRDWTMAVLAPARLATPVSPAATVAFRTRNGGMAVELRITRRTRPPMGRTE